MQRTFVAYSLAAPQIESADLLQFRPQAGNLISRLICAVGRSPYCHTAMAARLNGELLAIESREWIGGRSVRLKDLVKRHPGRIDVYRPCDEFIYPAIGTEPARIIKLDHSRAVHEMLKLCERYNYVGILRAYARHLPFVRWFVPTEWDTKADQPETGHAYCSEAYAEAIRRAFIDPVPNLPRGLTEPGDLTRSPVLANYMLTLVPDDYRPETIGQAKESPQHTAGKDDTPSTSSRAHRAPDAGSPAPTSLRQDRRRSIAGRPSGLTAGSARQAGLPGTARRPHARG